MTLLEALNEDRPTSIRIGCDHSSGSVYVGPAEDIMAKGSRFLADLDVRLREDNARKKERNKPESFVEWKPLLDRELAESYPGLQEPDQIVYIVAGCEGPFVDYDGPEWDTSKMDVSKAVELVHSVYEKELRTLKQAYRRIMTASRLSERLFAAEKAADVERWLIKDAYGYLDGDPTALIKETRRLVENEIREEEQERARKENKA